MARVASIEVKDHPELSELAAQICAQRSGRVSHLFRVLLNSPPVTAGWLHLLTAVRQQTNLPGADQELVILLIALINNARYEHKSHAPQALAKGVTQAQIDALANWRNSKEFDERQRAILAYADVMTRAVEVPDPVFDAVRAVFDARELVELTALIAAYNLATRFTVALQLAS